MNLVTFLFILQIDQSILDQKIIILFPVGALKVFRFVKLVVLISLTWPLQNVKNVNLSYRFYLKINDKL